MAKLKETSIRIDATSDAVMLNRWVVLVKQVIYNTKGTLAENVPVEEKQFLQLQPENIKADILSFLRDLKNIFTGNWFAPKSFAFRPVMYSLLAFWFIALHRYFEAHMTAFVVGAVGYDATAETSHSGEPATIQWAHTVGSGSDRMIVVTVSGLSDPNAPLWDGNATQEIAWEGATRCHHYINPATGSYNCSATGGNIKVGGSISFTGVDQQSAIGTVVTEDGSSSPNTMTLVTQENGSMRVDILGANRDDSTNTTGTIDTGTIRHDAITPQNQFRIGLYGATDPKASAGSVDHVWTTNAFNRWYISFEVKAVLGAPVVLGSISGGFTTSQSHTVTSGTDVLVIAVANRQGTISNVQWNGASATKKVGAATAFNESVELWYINNPTPATGNITATFSSGDGRVLYGINIDGANTGGTYDSNSATGSSSNPNVTLTTTVANVIIIDAGISEGDYSFLGPEQTVIANIQSASYQNFALSRGEKGATGTRRVDWYMTSSQRWAHVVMSIPAAAGATTQLVTVTAKARVKGSGVTRTVTAKARVKLLGNTKTVTAKARVKFPSNTQTVQAKARIKGSGVTQTVSAKARVRKVSVTQTMTARARVFGQAGRLSILKYRGVDTMKWNKDTMTNQPTDTVIENIVNSIVANFNITHIGVAFPLDPSSEYPEGATPSPRTADQFIDKWCDTIHSTGRKVMFRSTFLGIEGLYGHLHQVGSNRFPAGTAASAPTDGQTTWLGKIYEWIIDHPDRFRDGDIWAILPERTEGIFSDSTSFLPDTGAGIQANYAQFFIDLKAVSELAFRQIQKLVICGMTANNWSEVDSGWIQSALFTDAGIVAFDHYGVTHTAAEMASDLADTYTAKGLPMFHQEWGDYWNNAMAEEDRRSYLNELYDVWADFAEDDNKLIGFNYWGYWTGTQEGIASNPSGDTFVPNYRGYILADWFTAGIFPLRTVEARARVKLPVTRTVTAKARVKLAPATQTVTAKARVKTIDVTRTVTARARVGGFGVTQTVTAKARVKLVQTQTVTARARVKLLDNTKTVTAKARVKGAGQTQTVTAKARVKFADNTKTVTAKARVKLVDNTKTVQAKATVRKEDVIQTVQAKARIATGGVVQTVTAKARVKYADVTKTVDAKARVLHAGNLNTVDAKARVKLVVTQTVTARARVNNGEEKTVQAKARVKLSGNDKTVQARARIKGAGQTVSVQAKARVKLLDNTKTVTAKARVKYTDVTKTVTAKARVLQVITQTVDAMARVKKQITQTVTAKARILGSGNLVTVTAKARVKQVDNEKTVSAKARVRQLNQLQTVSAKARVKYVGNTQTVTARARVKLVKTRTVSARARIVTTYGKMARLFNSIRKASDDIMKLKNNNRKGKFF